MFIDHNPPKEIIESYSFSTDARYSAYVKQKAYEAMHQLEGWCSEIKAAILIDLIFIKNAQTIVEVGVYGGKSLVPMAFALKEIGNGTIYGIDPWSVSNSLDGMEGEDYQWWSHINHEAIMNGLIDKIAKFGLQKEIQLIRTTSAEAALIQEIDILHLDGNHSEKNSFFDVQKWVPLVKRGGLVVFDDLDWPTTKKAVDWLDTHCIRLREFNENNVWGIWVKP